MLNHSSGNKMASSRNSTQAGARSGKISHKNAMSLSMTPPKNQIEARSNTKASANQVAPKRNQMGTSKGSTSNAGRAYTPELAASKRTGADIDPIPQQFFNISSNASPFNATKKVQGFTGEEEFQRIGIKSSKMSEPGTVQKSINFI